MPVMTNQYGKLIVSLPEYQLAQETDPTTGLPWPDEAAASGWEAKIKPQYDADFALVNQPFTPPIVEDPQAWWIDVGSFVDRLGDQKIPILSSSDAVVQALVKDVQIRKYIDLKNADLASGIDILIAKGFTLDKAKLLNTPPTAKERYTG